MQEISVMERNELTLSLYAGIDGVYIEQLVEQTKTDPAIKEHTPDDLTRYPDYEAAKEHLAVRIPYALVDKEKRQLAGFLWFHKRLWQLDGLSPSHTFAIRIYQDYRGKGLSEEFTTLAIEHFNQAYPEATGLWLSTEIDNMPAIRLYEHTNWVRQKEIDGRLIMTYPLD